MVEVVKERPEKPLPPHFSVNCFPHNGLSHAVMSGPDGRGDQRAHVVLDKRPIANYLFTMEGSYDIEYVWRGTPLPGTPIHLRPRSAFAGEVGWHAAVCRDPDPTRTGHQILTSEFWRQSNDRGFHRHQDAWYPGPGEVASPDQSWYFRRFPRSAAPPPRRPKTAYESLYNNVGSDATTYPGPGEVASPDQSWYFRRFSRSAAPPPRRPKTAYESMYNNVGSGATTYPGPGEVASPDQSWYFRRFPRSAAPPPRRPKTAYESLYNNVGSGATTSGRRQAWRSVVPAATKTTDFDQTNRIPVDTSEEGSTTRDGSKPNQHHSNRPRRLLRPRQEWDLDGRRKPRDDGSSTSGYTTYMRLPSRASSANQRRHE